ncbi:MAG TPA: hypothetical protein ENI27_05080, partial [bacterium]|nr:hypothetical protein [bacterium]
MNSQLLQTDIHFIMSRVPKDIIALLKDHSIFLAGGFIRATIAGERVNDIDLFGCDKDLSLIHISEPT